MSVDSARTAVELAIAVCVILGILWRVLLPKIREELAGEIKAVSGAVSDVRRLVGENHHANPAHPTMPDRLESATSSITHTLDTATSAINDRLDLLDRRQQQLVRQLEDGRQASRAALSAQTAELVDLHGMLASHLGWSNEETNRLWAALSHKADKRDASDPPTPD